VHGQANLGKSEVNAYIQGYDKHGETWAKKNVLQARQLFMAPVWCEIVCQPQIVY